MRASTVVLILAMMVVACDATGQDPAFTVNGTTVDSVALAKLQLAENDQVDPPYPHAVPAAVDMARWLVREQVRERFKVEVTDAWMNEYMRSAAAVLNSASPAELEQEHWRVLDLLAAADRVFDDGWDLARAHDHYEGLREMSMHQMVFALSDLSDGMLRRKLRREAIKPRPTVANPAYVRLEVIARRLRHKVDAELVKKDPALKDVVRAMQDADTPESDLPALFGRVQKLRDEWWRQRYREAKINVIDSELGELPSLVAGGHE